MKRSRLPLTALRSFEAAGRHQSFKAAASELAVSEAAVSRQIRDLEAMLGLLLFRREHRAVRLTDSGSRLLAELTDSFDSIARLLDELTGAAARQQIVISVEPSFASLFLIPRLGDFAASYPAISVTLDADAGLSLLQGEGPSLGIRHSLHAASWPNLQVRHLIDDTLTPMLAPSPETGTDLFSLKLLRDEDDRAWRAWLAVAELHGAVRWGPVFSNAAIAVQSAELGQGVVLSSPVLARHLIDSGRLIAPFTTELANGAYWLVTRSFKALKPAERAFCDWLGEAVDAQRRHVDAARQMR